MASSGAVDEKELARAHLFVLLGKPEDGVLAVSRPGFTYPAIDAYVKKNLPGPALSGLKALYAEAGTAAEREQFERSVYAVLGVYGLGRVGYRKLNSLITGSGSAIDFVDASARAVKGREVAYPAPAVAAAAAQAPGSLGVVKRFDEMFADALRGPPAAAESPPQANAPKITGEQKGTGQAARSKPLATFPSSPVDCSFYFDMKGLNSFTVKPAMNYVGEIGVRIDHGRSNFDTKEVRLVVYGPGPESAYILKQQGEDRIRIFKPSGPAVDYAEYQLQQKGARAYLELTKPFQSLASIPPLDILLSGKSGSRRAAEGLNWYAPLDPETMKGDMAAAQRQQPANQPPQPKPLATFPSSPVDCSAYFSLKGLNSVTVTPSDESYGKISVRIDHDKSNPETNEVRLVLYGSGTANSYVLKQDADRIRIIRLDGRNSPVDEAQYVLQQKGGRRYLNLTKPFRDEASIPPLLITLKGEEEKRFSPKIGWAALLDPGLIRRDMAYHASEQKKLRL